MVDPRRFFLVVRPPSRQQIQRRLALSLGPRPPRRASAAPAL